MLAVICPRRKRQFTVQQYRRPDSVPPFASLSRNRSCLRGKIFCGTSPYRIVCHHSSGFLADPVFRFLSHDPIPPPFSLHDLTRHDYTVHCFSLVLLSVLCSCASTVTGCANFSCRFSSFWMSSLCVVVLFQRYKLQKKVPYERLIFTSWKRSIFPCKIRSSFEWF